MPDETTIEQPNASVAARIRNDGRRCGSASLRHGDFCYYHHTTPTAAARKARLTLDLSIPEDRASIQLSIGLILLQRIASNDLDPRRAGLLLYGLLRSPAPATSRPTRTCLRTPHPLPNSPSNSVLEQHPDHGLHPPTPSTATNTGRTSAANRSTSSRRIRSRQREDVAKSRPSYAATSCAAQQQTDQQEADPTQPDSDWLRRLEASASPSSTAAPLSLPSSPPSMVRARARGNLRKRHEIFTSRVQ